MEAQKIAREVEETILSAWGVWTKEAKEIAANAGLPPGAVVLGPDFGLRFAADRAASIAMKYADRIIPENSDDLSQANPKEYRDQVLCTLSALLDMSEKDMTADRLVGLGNVREASREMLLHIANLCNPAWKCVTDAIYMVLDRIETIEAAVAVVRS